MRRRNILIFRICNCQVLSTGLRSGVRLWSGDLAAAGYRLHRIAL